MIKAQPYDDHGAMAVLSRLDPFDMIEAQLIRGAATSHLALFADWRSIEAHRILSVVLSDTKRGHQPFAVLGLSNTGQAGVAQAALLSRSHDTFARPLARAAALIRKQMPEWCAERGVHRIEARCWRDHPTASRFLQACGFTHETDMTGFGTAGDVTFCQFAWTNHRQEQKDVF